MGEYIFIALFQIVGVLFNAGQVIMKLDKEHQETLEEINRRFFKSEKISLMLSGLILFTHLVCHAAVDLYFPSVREATFMLPFFEITIPYLGLSFISAAVLGYAGQRIVYKYFGKLEQSLTKKL